MGGRGHGAGIARTDSVRHADQGEDPSRALNSALQAVSPRKERKKIAQSVLDFVTQSAGNVHTHTHTELAF